MKLFVYLCNRKFKSRRSKVKSLQSLVHCPLVLRLPSLNIIIMNTKTFITIALFSACMTSFATGNNEVMPEMTTMMASKKVKPVTVERNCSTFTAIENKTPCNVFYKQGETVKVSIVAPQEQADKINTSVENGVLVIEMEDNTFIKDTKNVKINVESPSLESVSVAGSGNITAQSPIITSGKDLSVSVKGSGIVKTKKVECNEITANVSGSGNVEIGELQASSAQVEVNGSGNVEYNGMKISKKLEATINGSGNVAINGKVDVVNVEVRGSGNLTGKVDCDNVTATIKGSGDVKLSGDIKAHYTTVTGSGRVNIK